MPGYYFATLRPRGRDTIKAFSGTCDAVRSTPDKYAHQAAYMDFGPKQAQLHTLLPGPSEQSTSNTDTYYDADTTVADSDVTALIEPAWPGRFQFGFGTPPMIPLSGWHAGYGKQWESIDFPGRVDLLLALEPDGRRHRLKSNHVIFNILPESGLFAIRTPRKSGYFGINERSFGYEDGWQVLVDRECVIEIGGFSYQFAYTVERSYEDIFQREKSDYMARFLLMERPISSASVTPSPNDVRMGDWTILKTAGAGGEAIIQAATSRTGELVAVKQVRRRTENNKADAEVALYEKIRADLRAVSQTLYHVMQLRDVLYTSKCAPGDVYLLFQPLVRHTFSIMMTDTASTIGSDVRSILFAQAAQGLEHIHSAGWIHRDLKPDNIGIASLKPPRAVLLDLGQARHVGKDRNLGIKARSGSCGTIGYISPEMEKPGSIYSQPADIFALGCVGCQIFDFNNLPFRRMWNPFGWEYNAFRDKSSFGTPPSDLAESLAIYWSLCRRLKASKNGTLELIASMMEWEPRDRPTALDVHQSRHLGLLPKSTYSSNSLGSKRPLEHQ